ncbi:MAG: hypothetical protein DWP97_01130 [Calditrichaeota bacterium]|nr:MAG: hypothetical protein DWP97_01130 [Calditrichota bacterium]
MLKKTIYLIALILILAVVESCSTQMKTYEVKLLPSQMDTQSEGNSYLDQSVKYYDMRKYDSAIVFLHKAYSEDSSDFNIFLYYGKIYKEKNQYERASGALNKALDHCSSSTVERAEIYLEFAELELLRGDTSKALQNYLTVLQLQPDSKDALDAVSTLNSIR